MAVAPKLGIIIPEVVVCLCYSEVVFNITEASIWGHRMLQDSEYCIEGSDFVKLLWGASKSAKYTRCESALTSRKNRHVTHACEPSTKFIEADTHVSGEYT